MPVKTQEARAALQRVRTFHIDGCGLEEFSPEEPPRLATPIAAMAPIEESYPLWLEGTARPRALFDALDGFEHRLAFAGALREAMAGRAWMSGAEAAERLAGPMEGCPDDERERARARLIGGVMLAGFHSGALPVLHAAALGAVRAEARERMARRMKDARDRLLELIALDNQRSPEAEAPGQVAATLGARAGMYLDATTLAEELRGKTGAAQRMSAGRRVRIEAAIATLDDALRTTAAGPDFRLFHPVEIDVRGIERWGGWSEPSTQPFDDALAFSERQLEWFRAPLRALRLARLEVESAFDPAIHEEALERLDWRSAEAAELAALAPVVVIESVERLERASLTSFRRAMRSDMPLQILLLGAGFSSGDLSEGAPDFGALAMAHRRAFVAQCSMAQAGELEATLWEMARTLRPAVTIVATPAPEDVETDAWQELSLLVAARALPVYRYDPERGESWAERFELFHAESSGGAASDEVTAAHAAVFSGRMLRHFRVLPEAAWNDEQMELGTYLAQYREQPPLGIPFLWVQGADGKRQRAILTRELAVLCYERRVAWRDAVQFAARQAEPEPEPAGVTRDGDEHRARLEGARQAIQRIVASLTGSETIVPEASAAPPPAAVAAPSEQPAPAPVAPIEAAPGEEPSGPYIESSLCTSCNDCMKVNARVFAYDGNRQAYIADASAGTFAELLRAAEGCPAKCIHPGTPAPGDKTATPQLIARAAKFQ